MKRPVIGITLGIFEGRFHINSDYVESVADAAEVRLYNSARS